MYAFEEQIISMHSHGFDNIALMCGMYEMSSRPTVGSVADEIGFRSAARLALSTRLSRFQKQESINVAQRIKHHEILILLCLCLCHAEPNARIR